MKILDFIKTMESSISELKENLANGKLTEDTEVEVYLQHDDNYIDFGGGEIKISQLEDLEEFIKDYAFEVSEDVEELEELDLYEDEWESGMLDDNNLNDAKNGKVVAIIC